MTAVRIHACNLVSEKLTVTIGFPVVAKVDWGGVGWAVGDKKNDVL